MGIVSVIIAINASTRFSNRGEQKKAADVWKWFGLGLLFSMVAIGILIVVNPNR